MEKQRGLFRKKKEIKYSEDVPLQYSYGIMDDLEGVVYEIDSCKAHKKAETKN